MIAPTLWAGTPHDNRTALLDMAGTLELWFRGLAQTIHALTGTAVRVSPIGVPGGTAWLQSIQAMCAEAANALGLSPPPDLASYDLRDESDFQSWMFTMSQEGERLRVAAGLA